MADKTYNPPPPPAEYAKCPTCGLPVAPHGVGRATKTATSWRYACEGVRRSPERRTCGWSKSIEIDPNPSARADLAKELREMGREYEDLKSTLRPIAEMVEAGTIPEPLVAALPPGEIPEALKTELAELGNHACAAGLRLEMLLIHALAARGFSPQTATVVRSFRAAAKPEAVADDE